MRNILKVIVFLFILVSCNNEQVEEKISKSEVENIAKSYGYKVDNLDSKKESYKVYSTSELITLLDKIKNSIKTPKIKKFKSAIKLSDEDINKTSDSINNLFNVKLKSNVLYQNNSKDGDNPPYTHSITYYFDNNFPCANVALTINYNTNSSGQVISAEIITTQYGYAFGNTYLQTNTNSVIQNGILVYQVTGGFNSSVGFGNYSLTNTNQVTYTGLFSIYTSSSGGGGLDWVKQEGGGGNDQLIPKEN